VKSVITVDCVCTGHPKSDIHNYWAADVGMSSSSLILSVQWQFQLIPFKELQQYLVNIHRQMLV